jgi:hypothetical protein
VKAVKVACQEKEAPVGREAGVAPQEFVETVNNPMLAPTGNQGPLVQMV